VESHGPPIRNPTNVQASAEDAGGEEAGLIHNLEDWNIQPRVLPNGTRLPRYDQ